MAIEIVDFAIKVVIFHGYVKLPEGEPSKCLRLWLVKAGDRTAHLFVSAEISVLQSIEPHFSGPQTQQPRTCGSSMLKRSALPGPPVGSAALMEKAENTLCCLWER